MGALPPKPFDPDNPNVHGPESSTTGTTYPKFRSKLSGQGGVIRVRKFEVLTFTSVEKKYSQYVMELLDTYGRANFRGPTQGA